MRTENNFKSALNWKTTKIKLQQYINLLSKSELRVRLAPWNRFKPSNIIFLLTVLRRYFFCGSIMLFLSCVCNVYARLFIDALWSPAGKGWPLGSRLWCLIVILLLSHGFPESGVVLDCINSWSLPSFLLLKSPIFDAANIKWFTE